MALSIFFLPRFTFLVLKCSPLFDIFLVKCAKSNRLLYVTIFSVLSKEDIILIYPEYLFVKVLQGRKENHRKFWSERWKVNTVACWNVVNIWWGQLQKKYWEFSLDMENFWSWDPQIDKLGRECLCNCKINSFQEKKEIVNLFQFWLSKPDRTLYSFNI